MNFQNFLLDAIDAVLAWDLPDESFADAVNAQAGLMAGINSDEFDRFCLD